jgi:hypothetical protein
VDARAHARHNPAHIHSTPLNCRKRASCRHGAAGGAPHFPLAPLVTGQAGCGRAAPGSSALLGRPIHPGVATWIVVTAVLLLPASSVALSILSDACAGRRRGVRGRGSLRLWPRLLRRAVAATSRQSSPSPPGVAGGSLSAAGVVWAASRSWRLPLASAQSRVTLRNAEPGAPK